MANELKRRVGRLEKISPERDEIDCIRVQFVEPSPNGPRYTGEGMEKHRQPDGTFGDWIETTCEPGPYAR